MKKSFLFLGCLIFILNANAQTTIDANIVADATWDKAGSPYLLSLTIRIEENVTLTIQPGVIIKKQSNSNLLQVNGTLLAAGSETEPIVFTSIKDDVHGGDSNNDGDATAPDAGDWGSIRVGTTSGNSSQFQYCTFLYGGRIEGAVFADNSAPRVTQCEFRNSTYGLEMSGMVSPTIQDNQFSEITKIPIVMSIGSTPLFSGNNFLNNAISGIGLRSNPYAQSGESYLLKKMDLQGSGNTPYIAEGYIVVDLNTSLTIDPGVIIKKLSNTHLFQVKGTLIAEGTPAEPIVFTFYSDDAHGGDSNNDGSASAPQGGSWGSIRILESSNNTSRLQHCEFYYGGRVDGALFADGGSLMVTQCIFNQCTYGLEMSGMVSPTIQDNQFSEITKIPIVMSIGSTPLFSGNNFLNNAISGIGLRSNPYAQSGESYLLKKMDLQGSENTPYIAEGYIVVDLNTSLTIDPGVIIKKLSNNNLFRVKGTLVAVGTTSEPIVFTTSSDDAYGGDSNNDGNATQPQQGAWGSIEIEESSGSSSSIQNCILRYGGRVDGAIYVNGSEPNINHNSLSHCNTGLEVFSLTGWSVKNLAVSFSRVGLLSRVESGILAVDSSLFSQNTDGIQINSGLARINHSEFSQNTQFDISNSSPNNIDAKKNLWDYETFMNMITGTIPENLVKLNDQFDNASYGLIDYSGMVIPSSTVFKASPGVGVFGLDTGTVTITAYPVTPDSRVILYNEVNGEWNPETTIFLDSLRVRVFLDYSRAEAGLYDIWVINDLDTLKKEAGFSLIDSETAFGEWVKFEVSGSNVFNSSLILPTAERLYCLVKKSTHIGYSGTWKGSVTVSGDEGTIAQSANSSHDIQVSLENTQAGYYTFELQSKTVDFWDGYIKFCYEPDTITLNEWGSGQILRPYGDDWKVFELTGDVTELTFQTEGYGKWSSINVFKDFLGNMESHWFFNNWGKGYSIQGTIENPPVGKYYLKYEDSAVLKDGKQPRQDQSRDYLFMVGTNGMQPSPTREISVNKLSSNSFGQSFSTLGIKGSGLSDSADVWLISGTDTLMPVQINYDEESQTLFAGFDFSTVLAGNYQLVLRNEVSSYNHPEEILVEAEEWRPIGIDITGNALYRVGRRQSIIINITNQSNTDIENGYVTVEFDHEEIALNIEDDFYTPEYNDILNQALEEESANKHIFFFSNLGPREDVQLHLKMFSRVTNLSNVHLEVTSGIIEETNYNEVMSLLFNNYTEWLKSVPFPQAEKEQIDGYTPADWAAHMDLVMDVLSLNRFSHLPDYWGTKSASAVDQNGSSDRVTKIQSTIDGFAAIIGTITALGTLGGSGGKSAAAGEMAQNGESTLLSGGVGLALGGPLGMAKEGIRHLINVWAKCIAALAGNESGNLSKDDKTTTVLTEFVWVKSDTPEDKFGPIGASVAINDSLSNHFVDTTTLFHYRVEYWNKEDATAPAALVYIRDTLDPDFDLATFNFTEIGFLKWSASLEGGHYFNVNIDTRPDMPYMVNVEGTVDPESREVFWVHTTLDPVTMELTEDPLGGYLPPIDTTGYQLGWVSYTIQSKRNLPDNTTFTNQAFVNFDGVGKWGPAPKEGPFTNIFDASRPGSTVKEGIGFSSMDSVLISWTGVDAGSGVLDYTIFVSDGSGYSPWITYVSDTSAWFSGEIGKTYQFYSIARDRVGNIEEKEAVAEYTLSFVGVGFDEAESNRISMTIYPNPSKGIFILENHSGNQEELMVEVFNVLGEKVLSLDRLGLKKVLDLSSEPDGVYILTVSNAGSIISRKLVKH